MSQHGLLTINSPNCLFVLFWLEIIVNGIIQHMFWVQIIIRDKGSGSKAAFEINLFRNNGHHVLHKRNNYKQYNPILFNHIA
jgi:hypothetical protein